MSTEPREPQTITPYLLCLRAGEVIAFLKDAFDAEELSRIEDSKGRVAHAELRVGDSKVLLGEPDGSIARIEPTCAHHYVFVSDIGAAYRRALAAGGTSFSEPIPPRLGAVRDPGGNFWWIASREAATTETIERRRRAFHAKQAAR